MSNKLGQLLEEKNHVIDELGRLESRIKQVKHKLAQINDGIYKTCPHPHNMLEYSYGEFACKNCGLFVDRLHR